MVKGNQMKQHRYNKNLISPLLMRNQRIIQTTFIPAISLCSFLLTSAKIQLNISLHITD